MKQKKNNLYFFGSFKCKKCHESLVELKELVDKFDFYFIDVDADENQEFCDLHNVEKIPRVIVQSLNDGSIILDMTRNIIIDEIKKVV